MESNLQVWISITELWKIQLTYSLQYLSQDTFSPSYLDQYLVKSFRGAFATCKKTYDKAGKVPEMAKEEFLMKSHVAEVTKYSAWPNH